MTIYQACKWDGEILREGSILDMHHVLPVGARPLSPSERKARGINELCDAYKAMNADIIIIKIKPIEQHEHRSFE